MRPIIEIIRPLRPTCGIRRPVLIPMIKSFHGIIRLPPRGPIELSFGRTIGLPLPLPCGWTIRILCTGTRLPRWRSIVRRRWLGMRRLVLVTLRSLQRSRPSRYCQADQPRLEPPETESHHHF